MALLPATSLLHFCDEQRNTRSHTISLLLLLVCSFRILLARASAFYRRFKASLARVPTQCYFLRHFFLWVRLGSRGQPGSGLAA